MGLRHTDHDAVRDYLRELETKGFGSMVFPAFGGGAYGASGLPAWGNANGSWFSYFLPGANRDYAADAGDLWRNSAVAACMSWIAENFPEPTLEVARTKRDGTYDVDPHHELVRLIGAPNPYYDGDALWFATILSFVISGNAYWIKSKDPTNVRSGLPQLEPVLREIVADNAANTYVAAILKNMGVPGIIISPETDNVTFEDDEAKAIKGRFKESTAGDNVGDPLVFSLRMKIQELTLSPEKLALDKIRMVPEARICAAFRIPAMVVGLSVGDQQRTYANMAVAERMAYRNCLVPLQKTFAKALTRQLLPDLGGQPREHVRWDYTHVEAMAEERGEVAKRSVLLFTGGVASKEEARALNHMGAAKETDTFITPKAATTAKLNPDEPPST